ncbi:MAG: peptide chain release factor N(5)-glutamine methyltransferase [Polyangiaceae bacterium]|jgi:release factor glutamine methyltransferase
MTSPEQPQTWTIEAVVRWATDDFRARGIEKPRLDAEVLLAHALESTRTQLVIDAKRPLEPEELARFRALVKRRRAREPVAYLLGVREFYGRQFRVDKRVLIPRPDTETLVDVALARTLERSLSMRALDLCTGSGCVAITLSRERPTARVHATDLSEDALLVARENALRLGAYGVSFTRGDLFDALPAGCGPFDVIVANPPYIATDEVERLDRDIKEFEPRLALDGGADGLATVRRIVEGAPERLAPGGFLATEVGAGEAVEAVRVFEARGFSEVTVTRDYGRVERVVDGKWR